MDISNQNMLSINYRYEFNCKYTKEQILDGYKDRKARIRYMRAIIGTIIIIIFSVIKSIIFSGSIFFKHMAWYQDCTFWLICALGFMIAFISSHDKIIRNIMPEHIYSPQSSTYKLYLCEDYIVVIFYITGIKKVFKYDDICIYEVNNYFILQNNYLNGIYISKQKLCLQEIKNIRKFLESKSKKRIKNLKLPLILGRFARMPIFIEVGIIAVLLFILIYNVHLNNSKVALIGERVVCNNLGITVNEVSDIMINNGSNLKVCRVNLLLESFQRNGITGKKYNPYDFRLVDKNGNQYKCIILNEPNELKIVELGSEEKIIGDIYFTIPSHVEPEYLAYSSYNKVNSKITEKILLQENGFETNQE